MGRGCVKLGLRAFLVAALFLTVGFVQVDLGAGAIPDPIHGGVEDPIRLELEALGPVELGHTLEVQVTALAVWTTLEDVAITAEPGEGLALVAGADPIPVLAEGGSAARTLTVEVREPGTWALRVLAQGEATDGLLGGSRYAYLTVPETGEGAFFEDLPPQRDHAEPLTPLEAAALPSPSAVPEVDAVTAGPATGAEGPGAAPEPPSDGGPSPTGHSTFTVGVCWFYENEMATADLPQRGVTIQVWDDDTFGDQLLAQGVTGSDGCYTSGNIPREEGHCCDTGNQDLYIEIHLCSTWLCVHDDDGDFYIYTVNFGTVGSQDHIFFGNFKPPGGDEIAGRSYQYVYNAAYFARVAVDTPGFTSGGPSVEVQSPSFDDGCNSSPLFYRRSETRIHICAALDRSPDDAAHEYGHFVQHQLYGSFWPSPGGSHVFCGDNQHLGLAWTEGFGDWYGPAVDRWVSAPGATGDIFYNRPWDGSSINIDMESGTCAAQGQDNELNIARTLWDMWDGATDGLDIVSGQGPAILAAVAACDDNLFRDFYDSGCSWTSLGNDPCNLVMPAFQNSIDFNDNIPTASMTSQGSFAWLKDTITMSANLADADGFGCPLFAEFWISHDASCNGSDTFAGIDTTAPYSTTFDTNSFADDGSVWACVQPKDDMEAGAFDASAMFGVDNTAPNVGLSVAGTFQNGWFRTIPTVTLGCGDATSGVDLIEYSLDLSPFQTYVSPFDIVGEGVHSLVLRCWDNAGNVDVDIEVIRVDTVDPITTADVDGTLGNNGWYVGPVTVTLSCTDPSPGSGCFNTQVATDDGIFSYTGPFVLSTEGVHNVAFHSVDLAGNVNPTQNLEIHIDLTAPTVEATGATDGVFAYGPGDLDDALFTNEEQLTVDYLAGDATSLVHAVRLDGSEDVYTPGEGAPAGSLSVALPAGLSVWSLQAEDKAGWLSDPVTITVVSIPPGTFEGGVAPQGPGYWMNAGKKGDLTEAELADLLVLVNALSPHFGPGDTYGELTLANFDTVISMPKPPSTDDKLARELLSAWLNLVSGREPAAQAIDASGSDGWDQVILNTAGDPMTTALNAIRESEDRIGEAPDEPLKLLVRDLLEHLNTGALNV